MLHVRVSGSVWSSLIFDNVRQQGDKEGFLIGEVAMHETTNISDSQINKTTKETTVSVISHTICPEPFSFYDRLGQVDEDKLQELLKDNYDNVVGWFRCRSGSIPDPSLREITLHHHLSETFGSQLQNFIFGIFGEGSNPNHTTITYYYNFYTCNNRLFSPQRVEIENLGDTAQSDYKFGSTLKTASSGSDCYREILGSHKKDMIDKDGYLLGMQGIKKTNEAIHAKMKILKDSVVDSEEEVRRLMSDIKMLKQRVQMKEEEKLKAEMAAAAPSESADMEIPLDDDKEEEEEEERMSNENIVDKVKGTNGTTNEDSRIVDNARADDLDTAKEQNTNSSNNSKKSKADPFFGDLIMDMKASIRTPGKPQSNSDQATRKGPERKNLAGEREDRKLRSYSGSNVTPGRTEPTEEEQPASQKSGDSNLEEGESESDSTQLPDSPLLLEPSGSQTF